MTTRNITFVDGFTSETIPTSARSNTSGPAGANGVGITSIVRTSGNGSEGTIDTYTITLTNGTTTTFMVTNGSNGTSLRSGSGTPANSLGNNTEFYIDTTNDLIFGPKANDVWPSGVSLIGAAGAEIISVAFNGNDIRFFTNDVPAKTIDLVNAKIALQGSTIFTGTGEPSPSLGRATFDYYFRSDTAEFIGPKSSTTNWVGVDRVDLTGPTGATGTQLNIVAASTGFTAIINDTFNVDTTSGSLTCSLPAPSLNFTFGIKDVGGVFGVNNLILARNGSERIEGLQENRVLETDYGSWTIYSDGTDWWLL